MSSIVFGGGDERRGVGDASSIAESIKLRRLREAAAQEEERARQEALQRGREEAARLREEKRNAAAGGAGSSRPAPAAAPRPASPPAPRPAPPPAHAAPAADFVDLTKDDDDDNNAGAKKRPRSPTGDTPTGNKKPAGSAFQDAVDRDRANAAKHAPEPAPMSRDERLAQNMRDAVQRLRDQEAAQRAAQASEEAKAGRAAAEDAQWAQRVRAGVLLENLKLRVPPSTLGPWRCTKDTTTHDAIYPRTMQDIVRGLLTLGLKTFPESSAQLKKELHKAQLVYHPDRCTQRIQSGDMSAFEPYGYHPQTTQQCSERLNDVKIAADVISDYCSN